MRIFEVIEKNWISDFLAKDCIDELKGPFVATFFEIRGPYISK